MFIFIGEEGDSFSTPDSNWKADHGGASWHSQHIPLLLSGPGVRAGQVSAAAAQLDDIAPTVLSDMGVKPTGMEGNVLTDALTQPDTTAAQGRMTEIEQLDPMLTALAGEDFRGTGLLSLDLMK